MDVLNLIDLDAGNIYVPVPQLLRDRTNPLENYDDTELYQRYRFTRRGIAVVDFCSANTEAKPSTIEELEKIDKNISFIEKEKQSDLVTQKKVVGALILYSVVLYLLAAAVYYFYYWPERWQQRVLYCTPLLVFPILVVLVKKFLHWYFVKRISKNELVLEELQDRKKNILDEVMEKETYKKAKEILERFDPGQLRRFQSDETSTASVRKKGGQELRHRNVVAPGLKPGPGGPGQPTPLRAPVGPAGPQGGSVRPTPGGLMRPQAQSTPLRTGTPFSGTPIGSGPNPPTLSYSGMPPSGPPLPRPVLPAERGTLDRLVEYLVGDGPTNRYALICRQCLSHNGMALREEFEYLAFRCCYCYTLNPARKHKPNAPRIAGLVPNPAANPGTSQQATENQSGTSQQTTGNKPIRDAGVGTGASRQLVQDMGHTEAGMDNESLEADEEEENQKNEQAEVQPYSTLISEDDTMDT